MYFKIEFVKNDIVKESQYKIQGLRLLFIYYMYLYLLFILCICIS